ncbi:MAG TPA: CHASE2 domain-containing protein, partial [Candidatus Binataceae bacterium]|nr:CHASE2 domain-containing protein [Candidatus Binataceae bacterium]
MTSESSIVAGGFVRSRNLFGGPGRISALIALALLTLLRMFDPLPVDELRLRVYDLEQRLVPRTYQPVGVRIVAIDEDSLAKVGQWPWPRTKIAELVQRIAQGKPSVLGIDVVFSEPDRFSPDALANEIPDITEQMKRELESMPSNETVLAEALANVPAVLALSVGEHAPRAHRFPVRLTIVRESGRDPRPFLLSYPAPLGSLPEIAQAARGRGTDIGEPDPDGVVRRIPLLVLADGNLLPALSLEALRVASGAGSIGIQTR